jgi:hypothetical protein
MGNAMLLRAQRHQRIDPTCPSRGQPAREKGDDREQSGNATDDFQIERVRPIQQRPENASQRERADETEYESEREQTQAAAQDEGGQLRRQRTKREANAKLARASTYLIRQDAVQADGCEEQRQTGEDREEIGVEPRFARFSTSSGRSARSSSM